MNRPDIANLYRRHTRSNHAALPPVDTLATLAEGGTGADSDRLLADVGRFGLQADLLRFARDLAPESARLGVQLEQAFDARSGGHRGDRRSARATARRSWLRAAGAVAAGLVVAVSVWTWRNERSDAPIAAAAPAQPDRIFAAVDDGKASANRAGDVIFRGAFASDRIFRSKIGG